jgi:hypothetical protein
VQLLTRKSQCLSFLILFTQYLFDSLHDWHLKILLVAAIILHLAHIFVQGLKCMSSASSAGSRMGQSRRSRSAPGVSGRYSEEALDHIVVVGGGAAGLELVTQLIGSSTRRRMAETWRLFRKYYAPAGVSMHWLKSIAPMIKGADLWQTGGDLISAKSGIILHPLGDRTERDLAPPPVDADGGRDLPLGKKTAADPAGNASITLE